jgi:transcriptional regulator with XRE-family HTH domain
MIKTKDGRFIEKRVVIDRDRLSEIISEIKEKKNYTWNQFGKELGVSPQMIRHDWQKAVHTVPISIFKKLEQLFGKSLSLTTKIKKPFWGQRLKNGRPKFKRVLLPDKNDMRFAEFYGIMLGDGCIFTNMKGLSISGDKILDKDFLFVYIKNLINYLFSVNPSYNISKMNRSVTCVLYSKKITKYLVGLGFPKGKKCLNDLKIPRFILDNDNKLRYCIRGIMDTDGSLCPHPHSKIMIHLSITNNSLRKSVFEGLKRLGINGGEFNKGIMIYGKDKIKLFHDKVGFSNKKNLIKYDLFRKNGKVPKSREIESFIR